jgi:hypothetical protein
MATLSGPDRVRAAIRAQTGSSAPCQPVTLCGVPGSDDIRADGQGSPVIHQPPRRPGPLQRLERRLWRWARGRGR